MLLTKPPVPVPLDVFGFAIVGLAVTAQQTPLSVILPPPSEVMLPPETAVDSVIEVAATVVSVARPTAFVVNVTSRPYAVPALLVA
jgi:hypothetical protein